jgi:hypothetical protein
MVYGEVEIRKNPPWLCRASELGLFELGINVERTKAIGIQARVVVGHTL